MEEMQQTTENTLDGKERDDFKEQATESVETADILETQDSYCPNTEKSMDIGMEDNLHIREPSNKMAEGNEEDQTQINKYLKV